MLAREDSPQAFSAISFQKPTTMGFRQRPRRNCRYVLLSKIRESSIRVTAGKSLSRRSNSALRKYVANIGPKASGISYIRLRILSNSLIAKLTCRLRLGPVHSRMFNRSEEHTSELQSLRHL